MLSFATVRRVVTAHGTLEVTLTDDRRSKLATAVVLRDTSSLLYGAHSGSTPYPPGTHVVVWIPHNTKAGSRKVVVLGAVPYLPLVGDTPYDMSNVVEPLTAEDFIGSAMSDLSLVPANSDMEKNHSYGCPADQIPGEWVKANYLGGAFYLGDFLTSVKAGGRSRFDMFWLEGLARLTALRFQRRVAAGDYYDFLERSELPTEIKLRAATLSESLGALVPDQLSRDNPFKYKAAEAPFFNSIEVQGDLAQGRIRGFSLPNPKKETVALFKEYSGYDGAYEIRCASGLALRKSPAVMLPTLLGDLGDAPISKSGDLSGFTPEKFALDKEEYGLFGAIALELAEDHDFEKAVLPKFRNREDKWDVPKNRGALYERLKKAGVDFEGELGLPLLGRDKTQYELPKKIKATIKTGIDDAKGKRKVETTLYDLESRIELLDDGGFVLKGGFGEEIRAHRGNIVITCPGDVIMTPGRNIVALAGADNIQKSMSGTFEVEADTVSVVGAGDVQLAAGAGGESGEGTGMLVLESKSQAALPEDPKKAWADRSKGKAVGGGVLVKGSQVALTSDSIHMTNTDDASVAGSEICMRSGSISAMCDVYSVNFWNALRMVSPAAMLAMGSNIVHIASEQFGVNTSEAKFQGGKISAGFRNKDKTATVTTKNYGGQGCNVYIEKTLLANSIMAHTLSQDDAGEVAGHGSALAKLMGRIMVPSKVPGYLFKRDLIQDPLTARIKELAKLGIALPCSRYSAITLTENLWQTCLQGGMPARWRKISDEFAKDKWAFCYPGKVNLEQQGSLKKLEKSGTVLSSKLSDVGVLVNNKKGD